MRGTRLPWLCLVLALGACKVGPDYVQPEGSLYLEVGDTVAAARYLAEFIELWQDADPELQPRIESAQRLLAQLVGEESR